MVIINYKMGGDNVKAAKYLEMARKNAKKSKY